MLILYRSARGENCATVIIGVKNRKRRRKEKKKINSPLFFPHVYSTYTFHLSSGFSWSPLEFISRQPLSVFSLLVTSLAPSSTNNPCNLPPSSSLTTKSAERKGNNMSGAGLQLFCTGGKKRRKGEPCCPLPPKPKVRPNATRISRGKSRYYSPLGK